MSAAGALAVIGAGAVLIGLSLDWFSPGISGWTAFEIVDLLLAAIAVGVVVVALAKAVDWPGLERATRWLPAAAITALVLVAAALINHPPAAIDRSLEAGAWISLAGAILLLVAAILTTTEVSVMVTMRPRRRERPIETGETFSPVSDPAWEPPLEEEPLEEMPLEEPPLEEPFEEPATDEEPVEPGEATEPFEPFDELTEPEEADTEIETRPLRRRDQA